MARISVSLGVPMVVATNIVATMVVTMMVMIVNTSRAIALPPPEDLPEEIARTEIITEARSPLDGSSITAAEYAEQQASLQTAPYPPDAPQRFRDLVLLLQLRRFLRPFLP